MFKDDLASLVFLLLSLNKVASYSLHYPMVPLQVDRGLNRCRLINLHDRCLLLHRFFCSSRHRVRRQAAKVNREDSANRTIQQSDCVARETADVQHLFRELLKVVILVQELLLLEPLVHANRLLALI